MALRQKFRHRIWEVFNGYLMGSRYYSSKVDWNKLRPMILKRIENRAKDYPLTSMKGVATEVIKSRALLSQGVSTLLKYVPIKACKFCPEVYIGEKGHLIETCHGYRRRVKNQVHEWIDGSLNDILVPVEAFHVHRLQDIIKHDQRFDFDRIPAVLELCSQAGANIFDQNLHSVGNNSGVADVSILPHELKDLAIETLIAWENLRLGVQKLLFVYSAKVCKHCSEVHVGPSGHKARLCGVFKYETWRGAHFWKRAEVDDLVPQKFVWRRRNQDPPVLLDKGRDFYGHAPAVVELCVQAGAPAPVKYFCMMKVNGLAPPL
ncbi:APO domain [Macleaya cordata]|uniref:APO domain n=1 Tax=Macleaya cordata TaxID=56857 RepID=A0A200QCU6_MACCD|nr:APO domain [Macleaya cordata]